MTNFAFIASGIATVQGLPTLNLEPYPVNIPVDLVQGMQVLIDPNWPGCYTLAKFPTDHAVTSWRDKWYVMVKDAIDVHRWTGPDAVKRDSFFRYNTSTTQEGLPTSAAGAHINGKKVITSSAAGQFVYAGGDPQDAAANAAFLTPNYTYAIVHLTGAAAAGGLFGEFPTLANSNPAAGMRLGFEAGKTRYQHRSTFGDYIDIDRDTANAKATFVVVTCENNQGNIHIENSGVVTDHAFSFSNPALGGGRFAIGNINNVADKNRHISLFIRWNRKLTTEELTRVYPWVRANKGPFA